MTTTALLKKLQERPIFGGEYQVVSLVATARIGTTSQYRVIMAKTEVKRGRKVTEGLLVVTFDTRNKDFFHRAVYPAAYTVDKQRALANQDFVNRCHD